MQSSGQAMAQRLHAIQRGNRAFPDHIKGWRSIETGERNIRPDLGVLLGINTLPRHESLSVNGADVVLQREPQPLANQS